MLAMLFLIGAYFILVSAPLNAASTPVMLQPLEPLLQSSDSKAVQSYRRQLERFYRSREFQPLWLDGDGLTPQGQQVLSAIAASASDGIPAQIVSFPALESRCNAGQWAECELMLSASLVRYAQVLQTGWLRGSDSDWHIKDDPPTHSGVLKQAAEGLAASELFSALRPNHPQYEALREMLAKYRKHASEGGWPSLPELPELRAGERHEGVAALRNRLRASGDFGANMQADPYYFSPQLALAVKRFQQRHGLFADGMLESSTLRVLNITVEQRVRQLELALERWRWLPKTLESRHIWVNLVGGYLQLFDQQEKQLELKAIAGRPYRSTPSLSAPLDRLQLNPLWTVPRRIAVEDLLPLQQQNNDFFRSKNINVFRGRGEKQTLVDPATVNWNELSSDKFPYWLRQNPGEDNSMGQVKFFIDNRFDIFLHDTPSETLFNLPGRTFSSGCIRLEKPLTLASAILGRDAQSLNELTASGRTQNLKVKQAVPTYLVYMTSWLDDAGVEQFRTDVYGRDAALNKAYTAALPKNL